MKPTSKYETIRQLLSDLKQPAYRYAQITDAIFKQNVGEYERMTMLPKFLRNKLARALGPKVCSVVPVKELTSKQVSKVLFAIAGDERVEAVRLTYERGWKSYCISTQCGCGFGCKFCATGTIGLLPGIDKLTREFPQVNLTFSLHSPFDDQRRELMPINDRFPVRDVLNALDRHIRHTGRKVYIAYILLRGVNDSTAHAEVVAKLLRGRGPGEHLYHVNLIPFNSTEVTPDSYRQSDPNRIKAFVRILKSKGISVTVRTQFGSDINAACGQLYRSE